MGSLSGELRAPSSLPSSKRRSAERPERLRSTRSNTSSESTASPPLNLTLYGSPAPRVLSRPAPRPRRPSQPPNSPVKSPPLPQLPVDRIVLLTERLDLQHDKLKVELSERQIKLTERSSTLDLSIDLSSVANSRAESESSEDEYYEPCQAALHPHHTPSESSSSFSPPIRQHWDELPSSATDTHSSYPWTHTTGSEHRARSADLICVYVNTVNNREELSRYFRPCETCGEPCCVCPATFRVERASPEPHSAPAQLQRCESCSSRCSDFSSFLQERRGLEQTRQFDSGLEEPPSSRVSLSFAQLSTAARCARILADSLESLLSVLEPRPCEEVALPDGEAAHLRDTLSELKRHFPQEAESPDRGHQSKEWIAFQDDEHPSLSQKNNFSFEDDFDESFIHSFSDRRQN